LQEKVIIIDLKELRRQSLRRLTFGFALIGIVLLTGCVYSRNLNGGGGTGTTPGGTTPIGHLYVSDQSQNEILIFSGATGLNGTVTPQATLTTTPSNLVGGTLANPGYIFSDTANDRLYVANQNQNGPSVLVFDGVSKLQGNISMIPNRAITSTDFAGPLDVQLDTNRDILYVADSTNGIVVFGGASAATGAANVQAVLNPGFIPTALVVDAAHDILFAANTTGSIALITTASTLRGALAVIPNSTLQGAATQLNGPSDLQIAPAGRLVVGNPGSASITIYNNADMLTGNVQPVAVLNSTSPALATPAQLAIDSTTNGGELYVADTSGKVLVFTMVGQAAGNLTGTSRQLTGLTTPRGVAIDTTH
jgi:6-phosphogluconolactonase (cycloisomerase 2 family)